MKDADWNITELEDLKKAAENVLNMCAAAAGRGATTLALHGELGAGKTTFVQLLSKELGVAETVTSPTFVIMKRYKTESSSFKELIHIDAYRMENVDEMRVLGFKPLLEEKNTIICIEWAEKIAELLPANSLHLYFELTGSERTLRLISN